MTESKELVEIKKETVIEAYTTGVGLQSVVDGVQKLVDEFDYDLSTQAGIKKAKSFAAAIPRVKTTLDNIGKDLVSDWKGKAKVVDAKRKEMRDSLDALRDEAKKPIEAHEQEQVRIALEKAAALKAEEDAKQKESDWEFALLMDEKFDRDLAEAEANAKAERERIAAEEAERQRLRDEQIRADAAAKAEADKIAAEQALLKSENEAKAAAETAEAQRAELEAARVAAVEKAKQDAIEAKAEAARNKIKAEEHAKWLKQQALVDAEVARHKAEEDAKAAAEDARLAEIDRQRLADEKAAEDLRKLEANKRHVGAVRKIVKESLMGVCNLSEADAKSVVLAISKGLIDRTSINYAGDTL